MQWKVLHENGIPFGVYSANDHAKITEAAVYPEATLIYRDVEASTINPNEYKTDYDTAALKLWAKQMFKLPNEIKSLKSRVWIEVMNEPSKDGDDANWVGAVMARVARIANAEGYRICGPGWSPGTPEPHHWQTSGWREFLEYAAVRPEQAAVSLHEYSLTNNIHYLEPWHIGRFQFLFDACETMGLPLPSVFITECGWTLDSASAKIMEDIDYLAHLYAKYSEIKFAFLWTLQSGEGNGDLPQRLNAVIPNVTAYTVETEFADPDAPPEVPNQYTVRVVLLPPTTTVDQAAAVARFRWPKKQSVVYSLDDMERLMTNPLANPETSQVIAYNFRDWDEASRKRIMRFPFAPVPFGLQIKNPLTGLKLGHPLLYRYAVTSKFNAPRDYGNHKHEGVDMDFVGGLPDNKADVVACYEGTVTHAGDSGGNYGKRVRVQSMRYGSPFYLWYCHLDSVKVSVGDVVKQEQPLGEIGKTGKVTGEHLHLTFEVPGYGLDGYVVRDVVDPLPYLPTDAASLPPVPVTPTGLDMAPYFLPTSGQYGDILIVQNNWGEGDERVQLQATSPLLAYIVKNQQFEHRTIDDNFIDLKLDTSPGNNEFYTLTGHWMPRRWNVGDSFTRNANVTFYSKETCKAVPGKTYSQTSQIRFYKKHDTWRSKGGVEFKDVIELAWIVNGAVVEAYFYAPGLGLVGWSNTGGRASWAKERIPVGTQENNKREPIPCA